MFRSIFYLAQIAVLILFAGWILAQGGRYDVTFGDYRLQGETSILAVLLLVAFFILLMAHRVWLWFARFPTTWKRYRREIHLAKGHKALTRSLSALAAGDYKIAHDQACRAQKLLPDFSAVPTILVATTAEKQGQGQVARTALNALMKTEARDLGVRGLVNAALNEGNWDQGVALARAALEETPRAVMMQRLVYDLECQNGDFDSALKRQKNLIRHKALSAETGRCDRVMMLSALARAAVNQGDHRGAYRAACAAFDLDPSFVPSACVLIDLYRGWGKTRAALRVLHRAFAVSPHPELIERHEQMAPQAKNLARRLRYHEKFLNLRPDCADAQLMLARVAMAEGLAGEARSYLDMAEKLDPRQGVYRALARFAEGQGDSAAAQVYLTKGMNAPHDPAWVCRVTGRIFPTWEPLVLPERHFGTVSWRVPGGSMDQAASVEDRSDLLMGARSIES